MVLAAVLLAGCGTTRNVAHEFISCDARRGSRFLSRCDRAGPLRSAAPYNEPTMVGTTDAIESDVTQPGHPAASTQVASAPQPRRKADTTRSQKPPKTTPPVAYSETTQPDPKPLSPTQASSTFPTAKAVPDKPGYMLSPFDSSGRYVDVSGYKRGDQS